MILFERFFLMGDLNGDSFRHRLSSLFLTLTLTLICTACLLCSTIFAAEVRFDPASGRGNVTHAASEILPWSGYAGIREEVQSQTLELRDELIAAHMGYLGALEKALGEVETLVGDADLYALGWTRIEYLLETAFRLLPDTSEYEAFLKSTLPLRPQHASAKNSTATESNDADNASADADKEESGNSNERTKDDNESAGADSEKSGNNDDDKALDDGEHAGEADDLGGGLVYNDANGNLLVVKMGDNGAELVNAESGKPVRTLEGVRASPKNPYDPPVRSYIHLVRARAAWLRALALERLGRVAEAGEESTPLGLIRDWALLGPVEGVSEDDSYYFGENLARFSDNLTLDAGYRGKNGAVGWRVYSTPDLMGRVFPGSVFRGEGLKAAYFMALVYSPEDLPAVLRFGSNAPAMVFLNRCDTGLGIGVGSADPDREAANVWMSKGWNAILVRTSSGTTDWSFTTRLTLPDGKPFPGRVFKPDEDSLGEMLDEAREAVKRAGMERFYDPLDPVETGGISVLSNWLQENPDDARANFYLASFLVARRMMEGPERFDRELIFRRAITFAGRDAFFTLMAARSVDSGLEGPEREENLRLVLLKSVADTGAAAALVDIGRLYLDVMRQPRRADEYADMALSVNPMSLRAGVLNYDVAVDMGWEPLARKLLEQLVNRHPTAAPARLRQGRAALGNGSYRSALSEFHAILAVDAGNHEALSGAVMAMGMLGQTSAAVDLLTRHIERFPHDFDIRLKLVDLYRVLGRDNEARQVLDAAITLAPDDPIALAMRDDLEREGYAEGRAALPSPEVTHRQELDLTPARVPPRNGWEFVYFQVEDRMEKTGDIRRNVSFALKIYTLRAARMLRHLSLGANENHAQSIIRRLDIIDQDGRRQSYTPPPSGRSETLFFSLPPLAAGMAVEAEVEIYREKIPFLGEYFGHIAPLSQQAPVRLSRYLFTAPKDRKVYFKPIGGAPEAMVVPSPDGESVTRIWEMSNLPAFLSEPYSPGVYELTPCVQVSAFGDWDEFARWYWRLIGVQYHSPPELRNMAERMGRNEKVPMAKLDRAATWIAQNIGYRPWEYGPYAFRPINARSVLSRLSADGKDRTLLICLLAREYGLKGWPVLARMRNQSFAPVAMDGASLPLLDHFNYSLAMVHSAMGGDVFMDASNPYRPPAVMPSQLFGSPGLVVTPTGAKSITIPDGGVAACNWTETAELVIDEDGSILWEQNVSGVGTAAEMLRKRFRDTGTDSEAWYEFLVSQGGNPSAIFDRFEVDASRPSAADWQGRARLRQFATMEENRVIMQIPALPGAKSPVEERYAYPLDLEDYACQGERQQVMLLPYGFRIARHISVRFPSGWRLVNPIRSTTRKFSFGTVSMDTVLGTGSLELDFVVEVPGFRIAAGDFYGFREMAALVAKWIRPELVWEKP